MSLRIAVIGGGPSCEHDVSLASADAVAGALAAAGHQPVRLTLGRDGGWLDPELRPIGLAGAVSVIQSCAAAFPALHGPGGEDGTIAALLDLAAVPYVGSGVGAGAAAMDKWVTKLVAAAVGVAVAPGVVLTAGETCLWAGPVVVKPVAAGSSHGVGLARTAEELGPALAAAFAVGSRVLVERVVSGREIDVAVLGRPDGSRVVAPALEIVVDGLFDRDTKYDGSADLRVPAALEPAEAKALEDAALTVFDALGCRGVARIDFFLTETGPVLNEVNTMPGFTARSQVPMMFAAAGTTYPELVDRLVRDCLEAT